MRKQLITSVMFAAIAAMIGVAVVENQAANAITQNAGQGSSQSQSQNVGQSNVGTASQGNSGNQGGAQAGQDNDDNDDDNDHFKQSNKNSQSQKNVQVIKQKARCGGAVFSC
jgi:hypothetical protein